MQQLGLESEKKNQVSRYDHTTTGKTEFRAYSPIAEKKNNVQD